MNPARKNIFFVFGEKTMQLVDSFGMAANLFQQTVKWVFRRPWEGKNIINQMVRVGVDSLPVCTLTSLFTGMVLALQAGLSSQNIFNEPMYVGTLVAFSMVLELGPVLTSVVVAGRVGAAVAAEIGTMKVTEQIDALYTLGTNPVKYLAVPRVIACLSMLPILVLISDAIGILGGLAVSTSKLGIPYSVYWDDVLNYLRMEHVIHGLIKSFFFGGIIAFVACYQGFQTTGGAEGVGRATTKSVVVAMVLILVTDYFLTSLLISIGIG